MKSVKVKRKISSNKLFENLSDGVLNQIEALKKEFETGVMVRAKSNFDSYIGDLSREKDLVILQNGQEKHINVWELNKKLRDALDLVSKFEHLDVICKYWEQPIIWSLDVDTAATDGIRIAFNPVFAYNVINLGAEYSANKIKSTDSDDVKTMKSLIPLIFIIVHETYHQIYRHTIREALKGVSPDKHDDANYAQDAEINRDIELQFPNIFGGMTKLIKGVWEAEKYPSQEWEFIYDEIQNGNLKKEDYKKPIDPSKRVILPPKQESDEYVKGWNEAIKDYQQGKLKF